MQRFFVNEMEWYEMRNLIVGQGNLSEVGAIRDQVENFTEYHERHSGI